MLIQFLNNCKNIEIFFLQQDYFCSLQETYCCYLHLIIFLRKYIERISGFGEIW